MHLKTPLDRTHAVSTADDPAMPPEWSLLTGLVELTDTVLRSDTEAAMHRTLALGINQHFAGEFVAIAKAVGSRYRIEVFTHLEAFDRNADIVQSLEREAENHSNPEQGKTAVRFAELADGIFACVPFVGSNAQVFAVAFLKPARSSELVSRESLSLIGEYLSPALEAKSAAIRRSGLVQLWSTLRGRLTKHKKYVTVGLIALGLLSALPLPYRVRCEAELQPVVRRHIAAPFDGILQRSLVKPGDIVAADQPLGRLDAKELNWEIASATADRDRASKSRSANLAVGKTAAAQIDAFESRRLAERLKLLENRLAHLEIASPIAGVVVSGDMARAEGAPVKIGQTLFEVAPLDRMVVDVLVPEAEIEHVFAGQPIQLYLDAVPTDECRGIVSRVYPRAELRNGANVFVAEVVLDNTSGSLRPGMKGIVEVEAERRPIAWIVTHRAGEMFWRFLH